MQNINKIKNKISAVFHTQEEKYMLAAIFDRYSWAIPILWDNLSCLFLDKQSQRSPFSVLWNITYGCNCRCSFCNKHGNTKDDLNAEQTKNIALQIGCSDVCMVILSGGEPFF